MHSDAQPKEVQVLWAGAGELGTCVCVCVCVCHAPVRLHSEVNADRGQAVAGGEVSAEGGH